MIKYAAVLIAAFFVSACEDSSVPDELLVQTYADVIVVRERYPDSAVVANKVDSILETKGMDQESFREGLRSMSENPDLFKSFYDSVTVELRRRRDSLP